MVPQPGKRFQPNFTEIWPQNALLWTVTLYAARVFRHRETLSSESVPATRSHRSALRPTSLQPSIQRRPSAQSRPVPAGSANPQNASTELHQRPKKSRRRTAKVNAHFLVATRTTITRPAVNRSKGRVARFKRTWPTHRTCSPAVRLAEPHTPAQVRHARLLCTFTPVISPKTAIHSLIRPPIMSTAGNVACRDSRAKCRMIAATFAPNATKAADNRTQQDKRRTGVYR